MSLHCPPNGRRAVVAWQRSRGPSEPRYGTSPEGPRPLSRRHRVRETKPTNKRWSEISYLLPFGYSRNIPLRGGVAGQTGDCAAAPVARRRVRPTRVRGTHAARVYLLASHRCSEPAESGPRSIVPDRWIYRCRAYEADRT